MENAPCDKKPIEDARTCNDYCPQLTMNDCINKRVEYIMFTLNAEKSPDNKNTWIK